MALPDLDAARPFSVDMDAGDSPASSSKGADVRLLSRVPHDLDILAEFCDYRRYEVRNSPHTVKAYRHQLQYVAKEMGKPIVEVSPKAIRYGVKRDESVAVSTRNLRIAAFKQLHKWGLLEEHSWANPAMLGILSIPEHRSLQPPITMWDARRAIEFAERPNDLRVIYFGLYAGMRVMESASITPNNVRSDRITFIGKGRYGGKERSVPIHPELAKVLPVILSETPRSKGVLEARFAVLRNRHGWKDTKGKPATTHSLRRGFSDLLYDKKGVPQEVVKAILGHGRTTTELYAPVRHGKMKEAIDLVDWYTGEPVQGVLF